METFSLDGDWKLVHFPEEAYPAEAAITAPADLKAMNLPAISACVPGNVELDLVRAGLLSEPFNADNIRRLRPLETHEWWYWRNFFMPAPEPGDCEKHRPGSGWRSLQGCAALALPVTAESAAYWHPG